MPIMHASATWARRLARPLARVGTLPGRGDRLAVAPGSLHREGSLAGIDIPNTQGFAWHNVIIPRIKCLVSVVEK